MKNIILCSSNPILVKSLYGILRDEGHFVETYEHPAFAVQAAMRKPFDIVIIDSEPFGLSAEDAAIIIRNLIPNMQILFLQKERVDETVVDLEELKKTIHSIAV